MDGGQDLNTDLTKDKRNSRAVQDVFSSEVLPRMRKQWAMPRHMRTSPKVGEREAETASDRKGLKARRYIWQTLKKEKI